MVVPFDDFGTPKLELGEDRKDEEQTEAENEGDDGKGGEDKQLDYKSNCSY